jgi:hypothetical protein
MARLIQLIETDDRRGAGRDGDPVRLVTQYFTTEGDFVVEKPDEFARPKREEELRELIRDARDILSHMPGSSRWDERRKSFIERSAGL